MQKWEYYAAWVGDLGELEEMPQFKWHGRLPNGQDLPMKDFLSRMGEDGWEMVGAVIGATLISAVSTTRWHHPSHWLYFKRLKQ